MFSHQSSIQFMFLFLVNLHIILYIIYSCFTSCFKTKLKIFYASPYHFLWSSLLLLLLLLLLFIVLMVGVSFLSMQPGFPCLMLTTINVLLTVRVLLSQIGRVLIGLPHHHIQTTHTLSKLQFKLALTWSVDIFWDKTFEHETIFLLHCIP